jgi:folate-binding protein YgfZ
VTDIGNQYPIIDSGAGWHQRADRGRVRVDGNDRASFLQALLTNDLATLSAGQGVYSAYLTPQGRMIADMRLYARPDSILADVPAPVAVALVAKLDAVIFSEDVRVSDASVEWAAITVVGRNAATLLSTAAGLDPGTLAGLPTLGVADGDSMFVVRTDDAEGGAFDVFVQSGSRAALILRLQAAGIKPVGGDVIDLLRIEAGRPAFGRDMDEHTIPLEAGLLDRAISLTKGCYVGQEVIVRVLHRGAGRVAKRLVKLAFDAALETPPAPGTSLHIDGRESGRITSAARSPRLGRVVALGYLAREDADAARPPAAAIDGREWRAEVLGFAG